MTNLGFGLVISAIAIFVYGLSRIRTGKQDGRNNDLEQGLTPQGGIRQGKSFVQAIMEAKDADALVKIMEKQVPSSYTSTPEYRSLTPEEKLESISGRVDREVERGTGLSMEELYLRAGLGVGENPKTNEDYIKVISAITGSTLETRSTQAQSGTIWDALDAKKKGDYATAHQIFRSLGEQGDANAQYNLGFMYLNGQGVPQDYPEGLRWFRKAAEQGNAAAQGSLGVMYDVGIGGVSKDYFEAIKWHQKAAEQGQAYSQFCLGNMYFDGRGVPVDYVLANIWLNLAASRLPASDAAQYEKAIKNRDEVASLMTPAQIAEAQRLVQAWKPKKER